SHEARILPECEVVEIVANRSRVTGVRAKKNGEEILVRAKAVVLAAGAFMTPVVLLNSRSRNWPDGLANRSGQVGRNLMLHTSDFVAIDPRESYSNEGPLRTLALNDFYVDDGIKLGALQSLGLPIALNPSFVLTYLRSMADKEPHWWRPLARPFLPLAAHIAP